MKLGKRTFILIAGIGIVGLVILVGMILPRLSGSNVESAASETAVVRRGTLIATVSATGAISPLREAQLAFSANGALAKLDVKQGDAVKAGQLLASLDSHQLDLQVEQAEANLTAAQSKLDQVKNPSPADVSAAQANLASAEAALEQLKNPSQNDMIAAKADVDKAGAAVARAQTDYDRIGGASNPVIGITPQALALQQATLDYQKASALYNSKIHPTDSQTKQAQANVEQARSQLQRLTTPNPSDIKSAQANVDQARSARDLAKSHQNDAIIRSPFDGIVSHIDFDLGSFVPAGIVVLGVADTSQLRVKVNIDETDIAKIQVGQDVTVGLDAYPDANIKAKVVDVSSVATTVQGVVNYVVIVSLDQGSVPVRIGMTADTNIVVAQRDNALLVPNRAIRAANNKRFVTVQTSPGKTQEVDVKLGMANDQDTEVLGGLVEGQVLVISLTQNLNSFGAPQR